MIRVTRHGKVLHIETDIGSISIHDEVLRSGNASFETRILCYIADYLEKPPAAAAVIDLEQFREAVEYRYSAELAAFERGCRNENQLEHAESERTRLLTLIYAAPVTAAPVDAEELARNRYRPVPDGLIAYRVVAGDGTRSLFSGTKDACNIVARKLTEAFLDGAYVASTPAAPGIDLEQFRPLMQLGMTWGPGSKYRIAAESLADLIDASPKGGNTDENNDLLPELRDVEDYFTSVDPNPIHLATVRQAISFVTGLKATSAEVGS